METAEIRIGSQLSAEVQKAIEEVMENDDELTKPDFNATAYINAMFPTEQSLNSSCSIDDVISKMEIEIQVIDTNIRDIVKGASSSGSEGKQALDEAKKTIQQLFSQIGDIKSRAEVTEDIVKAITSDIKQLDCAKKNLTSAITTLNHLHMLVGGVDKLKSLTEKRLYGEISNPLQAITEVNHHFAQYNEIHQIKELSTAVAEIHQQLALQITEDFKNTFSLTPTNNSNKMSLAKLKDACLVISVLDIKVRKDLVKWFINYQLQIYVQLYHENEDISWLDKIDKRFAWIKRHLLDFEGQYGSVFPDDWEVSEQIAVEFCHITRNELTKIMAKRKSEIDVKLLLYAINKTSQFEDLLGKRFNGSTLSENFQTSTKFEKRALLESDKEQSSDEKSMTGDESVSQSPFRNLIGECFKTYLDIYTESIDRNLNEMIDKFLLVSKQQSVNASLESCAELFIFYKKSLVQCTQLSNGKTLFDLVIVFKKYLRTYAIKVLENQIPKVNSSANATITSSMSLLKQKDFQNLQSAANQVIHSFLKEGEIARYTKEERILMCKILTTSEYCLETVQQLEGKLKEKIESSLCDNVNLTEEKDIFHRVISLCIQLLVQDLENVCESSLSAMVKMHWQSINSVGDQSSYVNSIASNIKQTIPIIRESLAQSRKYFTQFCLKFTSAFIPKFIVNLYKCRPVSVEGVGNIMGCEQLLLDIHSIKTILLELPTINSQVNRKPPPSYSKTVIKGMTKAEMIVKIVMTTITPHQLFIEQLFKLLPDCTLAEFHKILDMKCIKRNDQLVLVEFFRKIKSEKEIDTAENVND